MTVLFCLDREATLERLAHVIAGLRAREHAVDVWLDLPSQGAAVRRARNQGVRVTASGRPAGDHWAAVMRRIWTSRDYVRTLDRRWESLLVERHQAKSVAPSNVTALVERTPFRYTPGRRVLTRLFDVLETAAPVSPPLASALDALAPDVMVISPAVRWGYQQGDYLYAQRRLGIRAAVVSDGAAEFSTGPLLRPPPGKVFVWNAADAAAATQHDIAASDVVITGAASFASWTQPVTAAERSSLRRALGLAETERFVLYVGSDFGKASVREPAVAKRFRAALRDDTSTRALKVLLRPHPNYINGWPDDSISEVPLRALVAEAHAVVGIGTRLLAEAAAAGARVLVLPPELVDARSDSAPRLRQLLAPLPAAASIDDAVDQIKHIEVRPATAMPDALWRPNGEPARAVIDALEALALAPAPRPRGAGFAILARPVVWAPVAARRAAETRRRWRKEVRRAARKARDRTARHVRRSIRTMTERRLAMRAFVLGKGQDRDVVELEAARAAREAVTEMARSGNPIIVGPWLSETGFELLYWIPFVRWAKAYGNIREDRMIVVSRGGAQPWYDDLASRYVDLLSLYGVEEFRSRNEARIETQGGQKQRDRADFEREIFERAKLTSGVGRAEWLHPSLMYNLFNLFWMQRAPASLVQRFTIQRRVAVPDVALPPELPPRYIAAKFYTNSSFPDSPPNRQFVSRMLRHLTTTHDVVLLNTGMSFDDHGEFGVVDSTRIHQVTERLTAADNLRLQTRIIGAADAYVGTYGGFSYLAPLCGVDAVTFFSEPSQFRHDHLDVAKRVFEEVGGGRFVAASTNELDFLQAALGADQRGATRVQFMA